MIFVDGEDFREAVKYEFTSDLFSLFKGRYRKDGLVISAPAANREQAVILANKLLVKKFKAMKFSEELEQ
jgi:hypothetical protein